MIEALVAAPPARRRRRRPAPAEAGRDLSGVPVTRVTSVRSGEPFATRAEAAAWLDSTTSSGDATDEAAERGIAALNEALFVQAVAVADPHPRVLAPEDAEAVRIGYGSGEEVAAGRHAEARLVDVRGGTSRRRRRTEELRPQERLAAILGGRERIDACEPLLLRARADLDAGRLREAALQLRVALDALLAELEGAVADPGHEEDMAALRSRREEGARAADAAIAGDLDAESAQSVRELIELCERVIRRRRVLRGG